MIWIFGLAVILAFCWVLLRLLLGCRKNHEVWHILRSYRYAHRGLHSKPQVPENSMAAFRAALDGGFGAELDVHLMKDGSLAVIHDSSLQRTAGADVAIEDLTREDLERYTLEESAEKIPLLEDVLKLFHGRTPLIVELKAEKGNHNMLSEAVACMLDHYEGPCCIESFDPRVVRWFKKHRSEMCRGQLAGNFFHDPKAALGWPLKAILTNLLLNCITRPDFVAYRFSDRRQPALRFCRRACHGQILYWTLTSQKELDTAEQEGALGIFETFLPK